MDRGRTEGARFTHGMRWSGRLPYLGWTFLNTMIGEGRRFRPHSAHVSDISPDSRQGRSGQRYVPRPAGRVDVSAWS